MNKLKKRRQKRTNHDWPTEIAKGRTNQFYNSSEWDELREKVLERDKHTCQFYLGKWSDGKHFPDKIVIVEAVMVHHIIPIKVRPDLCLDMKNCISLSFDAHEIIEDRKQWRFQKRKKKINKERW